MLIYDKGLMGFDRTKLSSDEKKAVYDVCNEILIKGTIPWEHEVVKTWMQASGNADSDQNRILILVTAVMVPRLLYSIVDPSTFNDTPMTAAKEI